MKAKLTLAIMAILAASAGWATDFVWTGGAGSITDWNNSSNWSVGGAATDSYPQSADDTATFNDNASVNVTADVTVGTLVLNANLTHRRDKWLTVGKIQGTGELVLANRGRLRNISGTAVECNNNIRISSPDGTDWDNRSAMPWIQANGANFDIKGSLLGDGHVFFTMSGYVGVRLYGDNSDFSGTVHVDSNSSNRMKFGEAQSGSDNMTLNIYGSVTDNGSMLFENGTIHFGSIYTHSYAAGALFRSINKHNTLVIGNLNRDDRLTLGMGDDANAYAKIVKVGTGTLELGPTRHREGTIISNGVVKVTHPDGICHKSSDLVFAGGTLQYGLNPLDDNAPVTKDVSSYVKGSTEFISVDTAGNDITWNSSSIYNNNAEAKGIVKKGEGTLKLSGTNRDGSWKFFTEASKTNYIYAGVLAIANGKSQTTPSLQAKILGTGTLRIFGEEANGGYRMYGSAKAFEEFTGTLEWANDKDTSSKATGFMLNGSTKANFDMPNARFRVTANPESATMIMKGEVDGTAHNTVTVGAFDHLYPNAQLHMGGAWKLNINGTAGNSYLNGTFVSNKVTINKTGESKLTIGPGFSAPEGSAVNVNEGVFAMDAGMTASDLPSYVTIASGVALTGEGVFGTVDLSVNDVAAPELTAETDKATEFSLLKATSITGESAAMASLLGTVNASVKGGKWKLTKINNGDGTFTLKCGWVKNAFVIVFR